MGNQQGKKKCERHSRKGPLDEFSVVYTDRAFNLMSDPFCEAMKTISGAMKEVYSAHSVALIPGSGTYAMEAVARQFGTGKTCLVLRNGYFSFRWSDIFTVGGIPKKEIVLKAAPTSAEGAQPTFAPMDIADVVKRIKKEKPALVCAPHVETSTGIIIPDDYISAVAAATHEVGGLFCLDCIASGNIWVDMKATGVDMLISAPQKGWTGPACVGMVMMSERARAVLDDPKQQPKTTSFCCNLAKWTAVMDKYEAGAFMYYTTLPTDSLMLFAEVIVESKAFGYEKLKDRMTELGAKVRAALEKRGFASVAHEGFKAPGVVVSYSPIPAMFAKFKAEGMQIAGGVPFKLDEESRIDSKACTFRFGLFGLDKLYNVDAAVAKVEKALDAILAKHPIPAPETAL